ncbi:MAG: undecaprenyldiphospho-muramoylpentapeptide beta-N-acetylglucosaminyltransferase [Bdellovibrionia bacterium]
MQTLQQKKLLGAGGGTGGHVLAGGAIAEGWAQKAQSSSSVLFVGARGGIEERLVPKTPFALRLLRVGSLNRVKVTRQLKTLFEIPWAMVVSLQILFQFRPHAVLGVGGYSSGPLVLMAALLKKLGLLNCQVAILEQNSVVGLTNRLLGRVVDSVFTAFPGMEPQFLGKKVIFTGNPIRSSMKQLPSAPRDPFTIFVFGGSQGARGVNRLVLEALPELKQVKRSIRFIHQSGQADFEEVLKAHQAAGMDSCVEKFIEDMPSAYAQASLLVCRSGASTLAEIAAVGRAAILVPLPTAADDHQSKNACAYVQAGAAQLMDQRVGSGASLAQLIQDLMTRPDQIAAMERRVLEFYRPHAARDIVEHLYV